MKIKFESLNRIFMNSRLVRLKGDLIGRIDTLLTIRYLKYFFLNLSVYHVLLFATNYLSIAVNSFYCIRLFLVF